MKTILTWALVLLAVGGAAIAAKNRVEAQRPAAPSTISHATQNPDGVMITYFTTNVRCTSCRQIETLTRSAVESHFEGNSQVQFRMINIDEPENSHFVQDYQLVSKSVVVSETRNGNEIRWNNLQEVWMKISSPAEFDAYVLKAITSYLGSPDA